MTQVTKNWFNVIQTDLNMIAGAVENGELNLAQEFIENARKNLEYLQTLV